MMNPSPTDRIRRKLQRLEHDDAREAVKSTPWAIEKALRARLNETNPETDPQEIERRVALTLERGARPTQPAVVSSAGIPQHVLAARRAERKRVVAQGTSLRRG